MPVAVGAAAVAVAYDAARGWCGDAVAAVGGDGAAVAAAVMAVPAAGRTGRRWERSQIRLLLLRHTVHALDDGH